MSLTADYAVMTGDSSFFSAFGYSGFLMKDGGLGLDLVRNYTGLCLAIFYFGTAGFLAIFGTPLCDPKEPPRERDELFDP